MNWVDEKYIEALKINGIISEKACSEEETARFKQMETLPPGIRRSPENPEVYLRMSRMPTEEDMAKIMTIKKLEVYHNIDKIRSYVGFFVRLTVGAMIAAVIVYLATSGAFGG